MVSQPLIILGLLGLLAASPAVADTYAPQPPSGTALHERHGERGRIQLSPQLKLLWRKEMKAQLKSMPKEQRHGWLRSQWAALSEQQKHVKTAQLEAKWKALPPSIQQAFLKKIREHREARRMRRQGRSGQRAKPA
jgi:hypothetical protein